MATKREYMVGLGFDEDAVEGDDLDYEMVEDEEATEAEVKFDEAVDTFLDDTVDIETRREALRTAIKNC